MRYFLSILLLILLAVPAFAQDDKGRVTQFLEQAFSGTGREVEIEGFRGALSSRVTMDKLTVADEEGAWLTLTDAVLDWNRASVLRGRIEINEISATRIDVTRIPSSNDAVSPEAGTFALPALPVSLRIDNITAQQVVLGDGVIGVPISASVAGAVSLVDGQGTANLMIDGQGTANLMIDRLTGPRGVFALNTAFSNDTRVLALDLLLNEAENGIVANLLGLPGKPALEMSINGTAPIDNFTAEVLLKSEGKERLSGSVSTLVPNTVEDDTPARIIDADIAGDLTQLFAPEYRTFFGREVALQSRISLFEDGRASLDNLSLSSAALNVRGNATLSADRLPEKFDLNIELGDPNGALVLLPIAGVETRVRHAGIDAIFDRNSGDTWTLSGELQDLQRADIALDKLTLTSDGVIQRGEARLVTARIDGSANGVAIADPGMANALGSSVNIGLDVLWNDGQPINVSNFVLDAQGLEMSGAGTIDGLGSAMLVQGEAQAKVADLSRFSAISGRALTGGLKADVSGQVTLLTGAFDIVLNAIAKDLGIDNANVDAALSGESRLEVSVIRNTEGLTLRKATLSAESGSAMATGLLATGNSSLDFVGSLRNVGQFVDGLNGSGNIRGDAKQIGDYWAIDTDGNGPGGSTFTAEGRIADDASSAQIDLNGSLPLELLNRRIAPNLLQGSAQFDLRLNGPISLASISGQVRTNSARLSLPSMGIALSEIDTTVSLAAGNANILASSNVTTGGRLTAIGRIALQSPLSTDVEIQLDRVGITDPQLYKTNVTGALSLSGAIPTSLSIGGTLVLDETEIRVPTTGMTAFGDIPEIVHLHEPASVHQTRYFAGLLGSADDAGGNGIGLDIQVIADNRIFVRGRGLDAELGGRLRLTGSTTNVVPRGQLELIRGRLDILGKRLVLEEGLARLEGNMRPTLRLVARTTADDTVLFVIVEGTADAPDIRFTSDPELPEDEVLARLLFGRGVSSISAFQAIQLASAVATLAGSGGAGIVERLRQTTGVDDLDLTTNADGNTSLSVGKYINENVYTDVEVDSDGQSQINLNLNLTPSTKLRGQVESNGSTGIGVFFERDY